MRTAALAAALVLAAPAAAAERSPRKTGDLAIRARDILRRHCAECHGEKPRRGDVSVLDHAKLTAGAYPVPLVNPADPPKSLVLEFIRDGSMPPGGRPGPTAAEVNDLTDWIGAGAPGYPRAFGDAFAAEAAKADWDSRPPADRPFLRYLSFAHLVRDDVLPPLATEEARLRGGLRAAAGKDVPVAPADPTATVFRLDLRAAGWDRTDLFERVERNAPPDAHPLSAFDLMMLEYPHAAVGSDAAARMAAGMKGVRRVPVVHANWLADALAANAPLTTEVRSLADIQPGKEPCGPRPGRFFDGEAAAGRPLEAWHAGDPVAGPFSFKAEVVTGEAFDTPTSEVKVREKHKLRLSAGVPVRVRVLSVLANGKARLQELERDTLAADTPILFGPRMNVPFVAGNVSGGGESETDYFVVFAAEAEVPVPLLLRSRHLELCDDPARVPIWRFLFDHADPKFDPSRVVRRVVPLTVRKS